MQDNEGTHIRFWGGLRTIGGTIVTIQHAGCRLIFDFGRTFSAQSEWLNTSVSSRIGRTVHDAIRLGALPRIDGLYSANQLRGIEGVSPYEERAQQTEVYLSHMHLDHMGAMDTIAPQVPVFMTAESLQLARALDESGERLPIARSYESLDYDCPHSLGAMTITPLFVDHDVPGASALHIRTPDGSILYTGDLRLHGFHPEGTKAFIGKAKRLGFRLLLMETTTLSFDEEMKEPLVGRMENVPQLMTEDALAEQCAEWGGQTKGLVIFNCYNRNVERLHCIVAVAKQIGRAVAFDPATAHILHTFYPNDEVLIFRKNADQASILHLKKDMWADAAMIHADPRRYMVQCAYSDSLELLDLDLKNALYIHAGGMPLGDYDPDYQKLLKLLSDLGVVYVPLNCSGHAAPQQLKWILDQLDPDVLIPLHGFHPERLVPDRGKQFLPEYGKEYSLNDLFR
ncbi:MBL fold metallo-hydrolase [Sporolactobacillus shoreicorticis]|uniref:MBL fold metallo-hydrolase n=1 Tax=Sporolactobacillus shoreicorticis TaxID=1923877 RepID=A0ABW5S7U0_9BACL|nr:MBL fold metallo-hydrolase [Sporolactobacillus shoreicorticis]MCO7125542.1 MBL fold metallo-hydrolase [Sporolactobacillus shoreicorticis]